MLRFGTKEIQAFALVARSGRLFRYQKDGQCGRFERRFGQYDRADVTSGHDHAPALSDPPLLTG